MALLKDVRELGRKALNPCSFRFDTCTEQGGKLSQCGRCRKEVLS